VCQRRLGSTYTREFLNIYGKCCSLRMLKVNVGKLDKMAMHGAEDDPDRKVAGNFALDSAVGTKSGAAVYFELEPGKELGAHTDSAEEIVYVVDGTIEATIGNEKDRLSRGELGVVPVMKRHNFRNVGTNTAKVIGFFSSPNIVSTFEKVFMPANLSEFDTTKFPAPKEAAA
jgi:quercetin dioxygenase-like cupin family protein